LKCRFCAARVTTTFVDLGMQPLSNSYVSTDAADAMEPFYPLHVRVCHDCLLVQLPELEAPEQIFREYAYLSSVSESWLSHCARYASEMIERFGVGSRSLVIEVASNDGYLLRFFKERSVPVLGIEPAANVAPIAERAGIPTLTRFFGTALARELADSGKRADLLVGNNVLAHVPDVNDFVRGLAVVLARDGVLTMEFPHVGRLIEQSQFDTIYHEHFSYLSFGTVKRIFAAHDLLVFDVEQLPTHGGSLRVYACHRGRGRPASSRITALENAERAQGLDSLAAYTSFSERAREVKRALLEFLIARKRERKELVAYGAAAKGNTLLNYCGIRSDFIDYVADRSPLKQGKLLPGSHIPVVGPERIEETRPDYVLILPWNLKDEIARQLAFVERWGARLVVPIPTVEVIS